MGFSSLRFSNFRNLSDLELDVGARQVFLIGENGQGKTNLIEAIHLLCYASTFRDATDADMMRDRRIEASVAGAFLPESGYRRGISLRFAADRRKETRIDGKIVMDRRELFRQMLCIVFLPQDMEFICGSPDTRRRFFDQTLILSDILYLDLFRDYRKILKGRNALLKSGQGDLLDVFDAQLASLGLSIQRKRAEIVAGFNEEFGRLFRDVTGGEESVVIHYRPSWFECGDEDSILACLLRQRGKDLLLGTTTSGPHRDSYRYLWNGKDYARSASTGQMRLCSLILRVAQSRHLSFLLGKRPTLLIDDVLLELDPGKKKGFLSRFPEFDQAFFTFLPDEAYLSYRTDDTMLLHVEDGMFRRVG